MDPSYPYAGQHGYGNMIRSQSQQNSPNSQRSQPSSQSHPQLRTQNQMPQFGNNYYPNQFGPQNMGANGGLNRSPNQQQQPPQCAPGYICVGNACVRVPNKDRKGENCPGGNCVGGYCPIGSNNNNPNSRGPQ